MLVAFSADNPRGWALKAGTRQKLLDVRTTKSLHAVDTLADLWQVRRGIQLSGLDIIPYMVLVLTVKAALKLCHTEARTPLYPSLLHIG